MTKAVGAMTQGRDIEAEAEAESTEKGFLLACSLWHPQFPFTTEYHLPRCGTSPYGQPPFPDNNQESDL